MPVLRKIPVFLVLVLLGCADQNYSGEEELVDYSMSSGDTIVDGKTYEMIFSRKYDDNGNSYREGNYIDRQAIGWHSFFSEGIIRVMRNYVLFTKERIELLDSVMASHVTESTTYLNEALHYNSDGMFQPEISSFYEIEFDEKIVTMGDSVRAELRFFEPNIEINKLELFIDVPENDEMIRLVEMPENKFYYSHKVDIQGEVKLSGMAQISGFNKAELPRDTIWVSRVVLFEKGYTVK